MNRMLAAAAGNRLGTQVGFWPGGKEEVFENELSASEAQVWGYT